MKKIIYILLFAFSITAYSQNYVGPDGQRWIGKSTVPVSPVEGDHYYNTTDNTFYFYDGTSWVDMGGSGTDDQAISINAARILTLENGGTIDLSVFKEKTSYDNFIHVNHNNVIFGEAPVQGMCLGNSIMQGTGSSNILATIPWVVGANLQSHFDTFSTSNWSPTNYGVGASDTSQALSYVSNVYESDAYSKGNVLNNKNGTYALIITLRNDVTLGTTIQYFKNEIDLLFATLKSNNIEPIFVTDFPKISMVDGSNEDLSNGFNEYYKTAITSASSNGATIVDAWALFVELKRQGLDLRDYTADGTHPNDEGYQIIADMISTALLQSDKTTNQTKYMSKYEAVSVYDASGGSVTTATDFTGLTTLTTARKAETEEATTKAFQLSDTETISFTNDAPCVGVIITAIMGETASFTGTYGYVSLGAAKSINNGAVREFSYYIPFSSGFATYRNAGNLILTSSGNTKITGVTFINEKEKNRYERMPIFDTNTTITEGTLPNGKVSQILSTETDYMEVKVVGKTFSFQYERASNKGLLSYTVDGGAPTNIDCYLNATPVQSRRDIEFDTEGEHTVRFTVGTKNASSSADTIEIGNFKLFSENSVFNKTTLPFEEVYLDGATVEQDGHIQSYNHTTKKIELIKNNMLKSYTVATLPSGTLGDTALVTDATAPTYLGTLTGGGSVTCLVFYDGSNWVSH